MRGVLEAVDENWARNNVVSGLSSGEGLIFHVRDEVFAPKPGKDGEKATLVGADPGVPDKRLLVQEPELASVLKVCDRQSNTLSTTIRQAWDGGNPRALTRNSPLKATDAHVSIVGHVTPEELRSSLSTNDKLNGFANRFLWVWSERSKLLPEGGGEPERLLMHDPTRRVAEAAAHGRKGGLYRRDEHARERWAEIYRELNETEVPGALGAATSRGSAQVMRLAMLYAILDHDTEIRLEHLEAAYALWKYSFASARLIFGERSGNSTADKILELIREAGNDGASRSEISELFHRHKSKAEIDRAISGLQARKLIRCERTAAQGRPMERWLVVS